MLILYNPETEKDMNSLNHYTPSQFPAAHQQTLARVQEEAEVEAARHEEALRSLRAEAEAAGGDEELQQEHEKLQQRVNQLHRQHADKVRLVMFRE